ncbi:MAG: MIP/aquaporin family protein [Phycicoccus sp.]
MRARLAELLGEVLGTALLIGVGLGVTVCALAGVADPGTVAWGWGLGVVFGVLVAQLLGSSAHLNPAVTLGMALLGRCSWALMAPYVAAQAVGALVGAVMVRVGYAELMGAFPGRRVQEAFALTPGGGVFTVTYWTAGADQVLTTALLVAGICVVAARFRGADVGGPLLVGGLVTALIMAFGANAGAGLNPVRDLVPRLVVAATGYPDAFGTPVQLAGPGAWWWQPVLAQLAGGALGAGAFAGCVALRRWADTPPARTDPAAVLPPAALTRLVHLADRLGTLPPDTVLTGDSAREAARDLVAYELAYAAARGAGWSRGELAVLRCPEPALMPGWRASNGQVPR